jgi:hypothetical protein
MRIQPGEKELLTTTWVSAGSLSANTIMAQLTKTIAATSACQSAG